MTFEEAIEHLDSSRPLLSRSGCIQNQFKNYYPNLPSSRPLLSRSGCIYRIARLKINNQKGFSSPFIEERLYLKSICINNLLMSCSRPLLSRSGCISLLILIAFIISVLFSSPFIEERLYLENFKNVFVVSFSALLSWSNIDQNNGLD